MSIELLTQTNPQVLREFAQLLSRRALGMVQELTDLSQLVRALDEDDWSGISRESFLRLWHPFVQAFRELAFVMTRAAPVIERLADELALAQNLYHKGRLAALDAGFSLDAQGLIQTPADGVTPAQAIDLRMMSSTINEALAEAQAADQRAAQDLGEAGEGMNAAVAAFVEVFNERIVPLHTEAAGALLVAARGLEQRAKDLRLPAAERANALQAASRYRALANNPVLRIGTRTVRGVPLLTGITVPLDYAQNVAEGDDRGEAATKAVVSGGSAAVLGTVAAVGGAAAATGVGAIPAAALGIAAVVGIGASYVGAAAGNWLGPIVHDKVVTPFLEQSRETTFELAEHAKNFPDDLRDEIHELGDHARNFPDDLRDELTGR